MRRRILLVCALILFNYSSFSGASNTIIPNVIVTKSKLMTPSFTAGPKTLISSDQIKKAGVTTLTQILQNLGGIQLLDTTGNGSQVIISMRGFGANASSNTLLLVNGIPITNPDMAPPDLNAIPISEIESVEITAGSESVLYGDQAVGGIINIITREHADEKIGMSCSAGSFNQRGCRATLYHRYAQLHGNMTFETNRTDNYRNHNNFDQRILLGGIRYDYLLGHLKFNFNSISENMQYPGALSLTQVRQNRRQATNNIDYFKSINNFFHLRQKHDLNANWNIVTDLVFRQMHGNGVLTFPFAQSRSSFFLKPQLTGKINNFIIKAGADWQMDDYQLTSLFGKTNDRLQKYGVFGISELSLTRCLTLSIGARGAQQNNQLDISDSMNTINRAIASTLGISYQLTMNSNLFLRRAESFRFPKADEIASIPSTISHLHTQRGIAYEAGAAMNREKYSGKIAIYVLHLKDEITFDPLQTPQQPFGSNTNLDPTVRHGATLSGKYQLYRNLNIDGQYNFVNARFQSGSNTGNRIPLVSESIIRVGLDWQIGKNWQFYTDAIFTGNQFAANDDANITKIMGGYTIYNFNLRYDYLHFSAALHLNNIFNKNYYFYSIYQPGTSIMTSEFFYPAPGRSFTVTVNYALA